MKKRFRNPHASVTLQELADRFGVTTRRIHQLEQSALRKLRAGLEADPELGQYLVESGLADLIAE